MSETAATAWVGWRRLRRGRWQALCTGASWGECWARLLGMLIGSGQSVVLPAGKTPDGKPAERELFEGFV